MKKLIALALILVLIISTLSSCAFLKIALEGIGGDTSENGDGQNPGGDNQNPGGDSQNPGGDNQNHGGDNQAPGDEVTFKYNAFTESEREMLVLLVGEAIPFIPNNEYKVEAYSFDDETGINFYTFGNTKAEFDKYLEAFSAYTSEGTYEDDYGDTWYTCSKGEYFVDLAYYETDDGFCVDVYVYLITDSGNTGGTYTDFTASEKQLFLDTVGLLIPFIENSEYYVEDYSDEYDGYTERGVNFYTFGNTAEDFRAYLDKLTDFSLSETYLDEYGDTWYAYEKGDVYIDLSFYELEGDYCLDVYVYVLSDSLSGGGGEGGEGGEGGGESGGTVPDGTDLITNAGAGLPSGKDGVFDVDLTEAEYVKDVTDQGYYLDGCPTVGAPGVLVIPVDFSDLTAESRGYQTSVIANAFAKDGVTDYYSVYDYYYISSYGQLKLDITVLDFWFRPANTSSYYANATMDYYGESVEIGDQLIMDEALAYLATIMDLSSFDSDNNGTIDAVVLINTLDIGDDNFHWAYRYWNIYTDDTDSYYEYDGVSANDYLWAPYQFIHENYDENGNAFYTDMSVMNTYTYIHEFGHILGADDYYDTAGVGEPMGGCDIMDAMTGDHNAFTKFNYGWITSSRLVTTDISVTLTLESFEKNGDTLIIANNWDPSLGAYQEYYIVVYYRDASLNSGEGGYFVRDGIVVYHINSSLYKEVLDGETYYDIYNNNTDYSDDYGTKDDLIEYVLGEEDNYTYVEGDSLPTVTDDSGSTLKFTFTVVSLDGDTATLTFSKI